ncbi:MAG: hypothetical protein LUF04_04060 [Bacteroides sp.]|nr:hypothetical protein [Bacteroides sp.]
MKHRYGSLCGAGRFSSPGQTADPHAPADGERHSDAGSLARCAFRWCRRAGVRGASVARAGGGSGVYL